MKMPTKPDAFPMRSIEEWEDLASLDPLWAILSDPARRLGRWDIGAFFASGDDEVAALLQNAQNLGRPLTRRRALDFGCGVGRLTRALSGVFAECYGVDISDTMIELARAHNQDKGNCHFAVNAASDLSLFPDGYFDLTYSSITLQHIPSRGQILLYIAEFLRTLSSGGLLAFQLPSRIPFRYRLQPRRRVYGVLRRLGFSKTFLYRQLGLAPIRMCFIPESEVLGFLNSRGAKVLLVQRRAVQAIESCTYFATR